MYRIARVAASLLFAVPAWAADDPSATAVESTNSPRQFQMEVGFRTRRLNIPRSILDISYYDSDAEDWALGDERRPGVDATSAGIEFIVRDENTNGIFYVEYIHSKIPAGYWDDREDPHEPFDGEYLVPTDNLGMITLGANYGHEVHIVKSERTGKRFGWSLLVAGGLGIGVRTGGMDRWTVGDDNKPAYVRFDEGEPADDQKANVPPPVLPLLDVSLGTRFVFGERFSIRFEGGLHTMLYYGATAGLVF